MYEAVKVALDPTPCQSRRLESHAGAARFAYNVTLSHIKDSYMAGEKQGWSFYSLRNWWNSAKDALTLNEESGEVWWPENSKEAYNSGLESLANALKNFSKSRKGQRKGRRMGFPRFKSKDKAVPRFAYTTGSFGIIDHDPYALKLPKIGRVHCFENVAKRVGDAKIVRMTISQRAGRWHASICVEKPDAEPKSPLKGGTVGIDLGVKELATLSGGTVAHNPHALRRNLRKLRYEQRNLSRKTKGSNRRAKARLRVAKTYKRVSDLRSDSMHKLTTAIAKSWSDVCIEDLNVAGMLRNHHLAQAVADASFAEFRRQLTYKTARTGARLHVIDRWCPSSKTCSNCGTVKAKLSLSERVYHCDKCGLDMDRDLNAAINIQVAGSAPETLNARGGSGRRADASRRATRHPMKREPSGGESRVRLGAGLGNEAMQMTSL